MELTPHARLARTASLWLAGALALQAAGGLLLPGLYRDGAWVRAAFLATDLDALALDVPVLLLSMALVTRGSARARLVWPGALAYVLYDDLFYLLGAAFNAFFLLYVAIAILAAVALVAALLDPGGAALAAASSPGASRRTVCGLLAVNAAILSIMWIGQCLAYVATGELPQLLVDTGGLTHLVAALDLTLIVPPLVLGAVGLWRARPWGLVVAALTLVQGVLVTVDLLVTAPIQAAAGIPGAWALTPLWGAMMAAFLVGAVLLLRQVPGRAVAI